MARNLISDTTLRSIRAGDPRKRISDGDGLYLLLFVNGGAHAWRFDYTFESRRKTLSLGPLPKVPLTLARRKADEARKLVGEGIDPSAVRKSAKKAQVAVNAASKRSAAGLPSLGTFQAVAEEFLELVKKPKVGDTYLERTKSRLKRGIYPWLGKRPIGEITVPDLLENLRRIEKRGHLETLLKTRQHCSEVFRYAMKLGLCDRDPAEGLEDFLQSPITTNFPAITEPVRVGELLRAIDSYGGQEVTRAALKLAPILFQRPGELRQAEWSEIDLDKALWTIPSVKMKRIKKMKLTGKPHTVPLPRQAVAVLKDLHPLTGHGRYVFPGVRDHEKPMSNGTVNAAFRTMGFAKDEMTGHGFRAMARTIMDEHMGMDDAVIEAQMDHAVKGRLGRAYNRTKFLLQRAYMMQAWADYLEQLRKGGTVVHLPARQA